MRYIARHYVRVAGRMYTPGEIFDGPSGEKAERMIALGAIRSLDGEETRRAEEAREAPEEAESAAEETAGVRAAEIDGSDAIVPKSRTGAKGRGKK